MIERWKLNVGCCVLILSGVLTSSPSFAASASSKIGHALSDYLGRAMVDVGQVTRHLFGLRPESDEAQAIIRGWESRQLVWHSISLVDTNGIALAMAPEKKSTHVGRSMASSPQWRRMIESASPAMGQAAFAGESGTYDVLFPLFVDDGEWVGAVCVTFDPTSIVTRMLDPVSQKIQALVEVMTLDGTSVYLSDAALLREDGLNRFVGVERPSQQRLFNRMVSSESGMDAYYDFAKGDEALEARRIEWSHAVFMDHVWVVSLEKGDEFVSDGDNPLTGPWEGAFSHKGYRVGGPGTEETGSSQLSAIILQDGPWCRIRARAPDWAFAGDGVYAHDHLAAAHTQHHVHGGQSTWYWQGEYKAVDETLRGTIQGDAHEGIIEKTYYLRRNSGDRL